MSEVPFKRRFERNEFRGPSEVKLSAVEPECRSREALVP